MPKKHRYAFLFLLIAPNTYGVPQEIVNVLNKKKIDVEIFVNEMDHLQELITENKIDELILEYLRAVDFFNKL